MDQQRSKGSVVLVDDDLSVRRLLAEALRLEGFDVETSSNAQEGWDLIDRTEPDVAVLDVMMPGGDGLGLLARLRASVRHRDLPVALLTARAQQEDIDRGRQLGADAYITKPFSIEQLVWHLEEMRLTRSTKATPTAPAEPLERLRRHGPLSLQAIVERSMSQDATLAARVS